MFVKRLMKKLLCEEFKKITSKEDTVTICMHDNIKKNIEVILVTRQSPFYKEANMHASHKTCCSGEILSSYTYSKVLCDNIVLMCDVAKLSGSARKINDKLNCVVVRMLSMYESLQNEIGDYLQSVVDKYARLNNVYTENTDILNEKKMALYFDVKKIEIKYGRVIFDIRYSARIVGENDLVYWSNCVNK